MIDLQTFHNCLAQANARGYDLDQEQKDAVEYTGGPLWLLAGPGSGKSEVLVTRTLKLLCVDGIQPRSIFLTTFTKKAAQNLEDRLASYLSALKVADQSLDTVDITDIRIGTLHGLCNDILQEYRYPEYQNFRLLDGIEQDLFTYLYAEITKYDDLSFWRDFEYAVKDWRDKSYPPNKWKRAQASVVLFNHIVEDNIDLSRMDAAGGSWKTLATFYRQYEQSLRDNYRCDFASLQLCFLRFLNSPLGDRFLRGDGNSMPPVKHILVDEYQDTNPIQERIYFALGNLSPHNLTVVGDDDQALYRFRGGSVACMVNFNQACLHSFNLQPKKIQLSNNYRSHKDIVEFFNSYITSFSEMTNPGVRAPGKMPIVPSASISGNYPAVSWMTQKKVSDLPAIVARMIHDHLLGDNIIADLSQCVLLVRSAKDSPRNSGPFLEAFQQMGIPVYNPRSKSFMDNEEVQCLLAALIKVIDKNLIFRNYTNPKTGKPLDWVGTIEEWLNSLSAVLQDSTIPTHSLENYLNGCKVEVPKLCQKNAGKFLNVSLLEIMYRILSQDPFPYWRQDPARNFRLSKLTRLFEGYSSFNIDKLRADPNGSGIESSFLNRFYHMFINYLINNGIDDDDDEFCER